ncbi:MAG: hypothetical protein FJ144_02360 [Deltaproteobacteria bacterium]|nr:hypothetical protein [Deltaproteobacteria bacterium]
MTQLRYEREELLRSDDYARPHVENGQLLHGGFDASGRYVPPRLRDRARAVSAWTKALRERGGDLLPADSSLLAGIRYPSAAQQKLLIQEGLGQTFWNTLTITGQIEARGRVLAEVVFPEIGEAVEEDVSEMAIGHLNRGLLEAHGLDEGGEPARGIGGHDVMWFVLRDLAFGPTEFPEPVMPEVIRPESEATPIPGLPGALHRMFDFLVNLLMIEFRAERGFALAESLLRDPDLFRDRRAEAERAAEIVDRIRADEAIHVRSLRLYLGEIATLTFRSKDGGRIAGRDIVDSLWGGIVRWATVEQPPLAAAQQRKLLGDRILAHPEGSSLLRRFDALEEAA